MRPDDAAEAYRWVSGDDLGRRGAALEWLREHGGHGEPGPDVPLLRDLTCLYLTAETCCVGRCAAGRGRGKHSLVRLEECRACLGLR